jgi:hypothetical protein
MGEVENWPLVPVIDFLNCLRNHKCTLFFYFFKLSAKSQMYFVFLNFLNCPRDHKCPLVFKFFEITNVPWCTYVAFLCGIYFFSPKACLKPLWFTTLVYYLSPCMYFFTASWTRFEGLPDGIFSNRKIQFG